MIPPEVYKQRRKRLMRTIGNGLIIIPPNPKAKFSQDKYFKYRCNSNIFYYSGITQEETIIVLDPRENKSFLFVLEDEEVEKWEGKQLSRLDAGENSGFMMVYPTSEFGRKIRDLIKSCNTIHYPTGINFQLDERIRNLLDKYDLSQEDPTPRFDSHRVVKDEYEIELIEKSMAITVDAHLEAIQKTEIGIIEYELEAIYNYHFRINGAILPMGKATVAGGSNAIYLHHSAGNKSIKEGELVLVDTGCEYKGYTSDVARTWPVSGKFTEPQIDLYIAVLDTHKLCRKMVKAGEKFWDIHMAGVRNLVKHLISLGLLDGDIEDIVENEDYKRYFMHGIGHFLGIDGHDCLTIDRQEIVLQNGMYLTIEPGLYIPEDDDIPEKYRNIGIRIEDNLLVTEDGHRNLSKDLPIEIEEIEELVGNLIEN